LHEVSQHKTSFRFVDVHPLDEMKELRVIVVRELNLDHRDLFSLISFKNKKESYFYLGK